MSDTLIAIVTCPAYGFRARAQQETWVPVVLAAGYDVEFFTGERLGVPDDYLHMPQKVQAVCRYAVQRGYKRMLKLDDDAAIHIENFETITADYAGLEIPPNDLGSAKKGT